MLRMPCTPVPGASERVWSGVHPSVGASRRCQIDILGSKPDKLTRPARKHEGRGAQRARQERLPLRHCAMARLVLKGPIMSRIRFAVLVLALGALFGTTAPARAATISVSNNFLIERSYDRPTDTQPLSISRRDCEENANVQFPVAVQASGLEPLEVWIGASACDTPDERGDPTQCRLIFTTEASTGTVLINISSQQIVGEGCEGEQDATTPIERTLFFAFSDATGEPDTSQSDTQTITYDMKAPVPPQFNELGGGDGQLIPRWDVVETSDLVGYRFYCEVSTTNGEVGAGGEGGAGSAECPSSLQPDTVPDESLFCGRQAGQLASRGTISGLTNGQLYAVGITSTDLVGNVGLLSNVRCKEPEEVTDFYEAYTEAGGEGGGGFCALGRDRSPNAFSLGMLAVLGLALGRRRNQSP